MINKILVGIILVVSIVIFTDVPFAQAQVSCGDAGSVSSTELCNPTAKFAPDFPRFLINIAKVFGFIVGFNAIVYVVFAGFKMIVSQGNSEEVAKAKAALQWALLGMLLIFSSFLLVYAVSSFIGTADVNPNIDEPIRDSVTIPTQANDFGIFLENFLKNFLGLAGLIALLMIIINGFRYVLSGGNNEQTESAKEGLQWAVIGLVIIALAYTIVTATAKLLPS